MEYERIVSRAWRIVWNNKYLWLFGFLAGLTLGSGSDSNPYVQGGAWLFQNVGGFVGTGGITAIVTLILALVFWFLGTMARSGLVYEVGAIDARRQDPVGKVWGLFRTGLHFLPRILLMQLIIWSPVLVLGVVASLFSQSIATTAFSNFRTGNLEPPSFFGAVGVVGLLGLATFLFTIPTLFIDAFGYRAIVLEGTSVKEGILRAYEVLKANLVETLILGVLFLVLGLLFTWILGVLLSPLLLPVMKPVAQRMETCVDLQADFQAMTACIQQLNAAPLLLV